MGRLREGNTGRFALPLARFRILVVGREGGSDLDRSLEQGVEGSHVTYAGSLAEAQDLLIGDFDAAITELDLPDAAGAAVVGGLLERDPLLPVVVLAEEGARASALLAIERGAQDYVTHDELSPSVLRRVIRHAISRARAARAQQAVAEGLEAVRNARLSVSELLARSQAEAEAVPQALRALAGVMGWSWTELWEASPGADQLRLVSCWGRPELRQTEFERIARAIHPAPGECAAGAAWKSGKPATLVVPGEADSPRAAAAKTAGLKAAMAAPARLMSGGTVVLGAFTDTAPGDSAFGPHLLHDVVLLLAAFLDRCRAHAAQGESERRHAAILASALDAIVSMDHEGRITGWNPAAERVFGLPAAEALGRSLVETIVPPAYRRRHLAGVARYLQSGESRILGRRVELEAQRADGRTFPAELSIVRVGDGEPPRFTATLRDITERSASAKALQSSEARWRSLVTNAPDVILTTDADLRIRFINRSEVMPLEAVLDRPVLEFVHAPDRARVERVLREVLATGRPATYESYTGEDPGELRCWRTRVGVDAGVDGSTRGLLMIATDVTEAKRTEGALRDRERDLQRAQRMEAVGQLAAGIAHDFNNLLTGVLGFSQFALRQLEPGSPVAGDVAQIRAAAERAASLTRRLLAFTRQQHLEPQVCDPEALMDSIEPILRKAVREDIDLGVTCRRRIGAIDVDAGLLEQALLNLVINARDAMTSGGRVDIEIDRANVAAADAPAYGLKLGGDYVAIRVKDTGTGMTEEQLARACDPFFTTKAAGRGTGLGLAMVHGFARQSGGGMRLSSVEGRGTTVTLLFPRTKPNGTPAPTESHDKPSTITRTARILLVEDEDGLRELMSRILRAIGHQVTACANGTQAIGAVDDAGEPFELIVSDMVMPEMNGWEVVRQLRPRFPDLRVLYVTGYADTGLIRREVLQPGIPLLRKPFTPDAFELAVAAVLREADEEEQEERKERWDLGENW